MKLKQLRADRDAITGKLSDIVRQLDFAGIAMIWIFRTSPVSGNIPYDRTLLWPLGALTLSLICDLTQYAWGSALFDKRCAEYSKGLAHDDTDVPGHSPRLLWPSRVFFWSKTAFAVIAYVLLLKFIAHRL